MKKEMILGVFVFVLMTSMFCFVVAETVEGTTSVSFQSGNSDNPNADASQTTNESRGESIIEWIVALVAIIVVVLVAYMFYARRGANGRKNSIINKNNRKRH